MDRSRIELPFIGGSKHGNWIPVPMTPDGRPMTPTLEFPVRKSPKVIFGVTLVPDEPMKTETYRARLFKGIIPNALECLALPGFQVTWQGWVFVSTKLDKMPEPELEHETHQVLMARLWWRLLKPASEARQF